MSVLHVLATARAEKCVISKKGMLKNIPLLLLLLPVKLRWIVVMLQNPSNVSVSCSFFSNSKSTNIARKACFWTDFQPSFIMGNFIQHGGRLNSLVILNSHVFGLFTLLPLNQTQLMMLWCCPQKLYDFVVHGGIQPFVNPGKSKLGLCCDCIFRSMVRKKPDKQYICLRTFLQF